MCLSPVNNIIETAKEDIQVWKLIGIINTSFYQFFNYHPNKLYRLKKKLRIINGVRVDEGFHAYRTKQRARLTQCSMHINAQREYKVVEFTIPKGAKYIIGDNGDIVSTSIRSGSLEPIKG